MTDLELIGLEYIREDAARLRSAINRHDVDAVEKRVSSFCHEGFRYDPDGNEAGICSHSVTTNGKTRAEVLEEVGRYCLLRYEAGEGGC